MNKRKRQSPSSSSTLKSFFSSPITSTSSSSITTSSLSLCPVCNKSYEIGDILEKHITECIENAMNNSNNNNSNNNNIDNTNNAFSILIKASKKQSVPILVYILDLIDNKLICSIDHHHNNLDRCNSKDYYNETFTLNNFPNNDKKMKVRIYLSSNIKPIPSLASQSMTSSSSSSSSSSTTAATDNDNVHPSIIKSMIQKGVRRGLVKEVIKISNYLSLCSLEDFLRRIPIIILEDVILHPAYPIIVWIMLAQSKSYKVPMFLTRICILVLAEVTASHERDIYPSSDDNNDNDTKNDNIDTTSLNINNDANNDASNNDTSNNDTSKDTKNDINNNDTNVDDTEERTLLQQLVQMSNVSHKTTLLSLLFRVCYGGMKGDMIMLQDYNKTWHSRFNAYSNSNNDTTLPNTKLVMNSYLHDRYLEDFGFHQLLSLFPCSTDNSANINILTSLSNMIATDITTFLNHNNTTDVTASSSVQSKDILKMTASDLVPFGIDHICDSGLVNYIQSLKQDDITDYLANNQSEYNNNDAIKECIWQFRSSINNRKLWAYLSDAETQGQRSWNSQQLSKKKKLAGLWKLITPYLNTYCDNRLRALWKKIEKQQQQFF